VKADLLEGISTNGQQTLVLVAIAERFRSQSQKPFWKSVDGPTSLLQFDLRLNVYKGDVNKGSFERINFIDRYLPSVALC